MGSVKLILILILKLLFVQINGEEYWKEDCIILSEEASRLNVKYSSMGASGFKLEIPEFDRIGNNFDLGVFNFIGSKLIYQY
jgi:hypothetical protein